ncbi:MAG: S-layer homology domain-containing protein, partial [Oscillospiraceae bacterium]|nr:S-layer homology domain-containing protein [Oscillospiraceae bacterium]
AMLVKAIGTMVNKPGTHTLGGVYGNVMISSSGVALKDTTIAGNLYITGGLASGDILLDNVTVLGKIIVSGAGESNKGDSSVILRNVESGELVVDSIANQFVSLRAEGDTQIDFTEVKTGAYLDDQTDEGDGLLYVEINGEAGMNVTMAGNVEEVLNRTPLSTLVMAQGKAKFVTVDENAIGAMLEIKNIATIEELNLDTGIAVTGEGDIAEINVSAAGAVVDILPDDINIRPGLQATIMGEEMDTKEGDESSEDPRILAGYPVMKNIAPTSAEVVFETNKKGTIYWALTNVIDGPVSAEDLLEVKDYNTLILQQGSVSATESAKDFRVKISKLTSEGTYYVSAVLVDSRGQCSAVKYTVFTTPDATAPKFATGYPELTLVKMDYAQVSVMSTKSSVLYYALLPKGAGAPTINEFKAGAISGDLGNCPVKGIPVTKNVVRILNVCDEGKLEEQTTYELYLCLIDPDNGKDSGIKRITFTTVDGTPPVLADAVVTGIQKSAVNLTTSMNEPGTIYWVAVRAGQDFVGDNDERAVVLQIVNGIGNIVKAGKANAAADKEVVLKISGLESETTYDFYYVAQDKAGNHSEVKMISANTLDDEAPTVRQEFTKTTDALGLEPLAETDVKLIFSEGVRNKDSDTSFHDLYKVIKDKNSTLFEVTEARKALVQELEKSVQLWDISNVSAAYQVKHDPDMTAEDTGTWINYKKVEMEMTPEGDLVLEFKHGVAISLSSGSTYQFMIEDVTDVSNAKNAIRPNPLKMDPFTTVFAQVNLTSRASGNLVLPGDPVS